MSIGFHINKGTHKTTEDAIRAVDFVDMGNRWIQVFTHGPRSFHPINIGDLSDFKILIHSSYLSYAFNRREGLTKHINTQLKLASEIGAEGVVIHLTKLTPDRILEGMLELDTVAKTILEIESYLPKYDERMDTNNNCTYETPEKLNYLCELLMDYELNFGICIDTAHLHSAGVSVKTMKDMSSWINKFKYHNLISAIHFNGSKTKLGSGIDRHALPFYKDDCIWSDVAYQNSGARVLLKLAKRRRIPVVIEHREDMSDSVVQQHILKLLDAIESDSDYKDSFSAPKV